MTRPAAAASEASRGATSTDPGSLQGYRAQWAELALAIGGFGIGTGEFVMMGLLPNVARDLSITIPSAGRVITPMRWV